MANPERRLPHLTPGKVPLRRWRWDGGQGGHLTIGTVGARWYVDDTRDKHLLVYDDRDGALTEARRRMSGDDRWHRVNAAYGPRGEKLEDVEVDWDV